MSRKLTKILQKIDQNFTKKSTKFYCARKAIPLGADKRSKMGELSHLTPPCNICLILCQGLGGAWLWLRGLARFSAWSSRRWSV